MNYLINLLEKHKNGNISTDDALNELKSLPYKNMNFARVDHHRALRQGFPEVIFCPGKQKEHIVEIFQEIKKNSHIVLGTRADETIANFVQTHIPEIIYHKKARILRYGEIPDPTTQNYTLVISAGTADMPVACEAIITLQSNGVKTECLFDCGVSGSHRVFDHIDKIMNASAIVAVAGMEGALASFIGGIASCPVVAVPTSVGYGANFGGVTALLSMLNSCASAVSVVNIDNGFGAGCIASMITKQSK